MGKAYSRYTVQVVFHDGVRVTYSSKPNVFPSTAEGLQSMRDGLAAAVGTLDHAIAAAQKAEEFPKA
jgi:hypothetical protein